jgi:hypothetical protein
MPTLLRFKGFRFFFFSLHRGEPAHVHVEHGDKVAKFWLEPVRLARSDGFRAHELNDLREIVGSRATEFMEAWREHFDSPG